MLGLRSLNQVGDTVSIRSGHLLSRRSDASDVFSAAFYSLEDGVSTLFGFGFELTPKGLGIARCAVYPRSMSSYILSSVLNAGDLESRSGCDEHG